ncbi:MAG TPA: MFS transporter [Gaiellaceae bacterium]|jgi:MFS family permease|nr:MFS transporter [Gaiellaceae bacterium]
MRKPRMLEPLRIRDFALLWTGMSVSLIGDGILLVALAWQTYELSGSASTLGWIAAAYVSPMVVVLLGGGVLTDRFERRKLMIVADLIRVVSVGAMGALAVTGHLGLWQLGLLAALTGVGDALFAPAFGSIVPEIVPRELLVEANSLDQFMRPLSNVIGPAIAGVLIASAGVGTAFVADAATFVISTATAFALTPRPFQHVAERSAKRELREGFAFVRARKWLWATLLISAVVMVGPAARYVLLPDLVKNDLHASAGALGFVYGAAAVGSIVGAVGYGQLGLVKRYVLVMYASWAVGLFAVAAYGVAGDVPQLLALGFVGGIGLAFGQATWGTMMHRLVPREVLGRVTSLDWLCATSLMPLWFVVIGFVADGAGVRATLVAGGLIAGITTLLFPFAIPGIREPEHDAAAFGGPRPRLAPGAPDV